MGVDLSFLPRLRELTDANEHVLALWFIAKQSYQPTDDYADLFCEYMLAGELTTELHEQYLIRSKELIRRIWLNDPEGAEKIRMCL